MKKFGQFKHAILKNQILIKICRDLPKLLLNKQNRIVFSKFILEKIPIVAPSVRPSVRQFVRPSVRPSVSLSATRFVLGNNLFLRQVQIQNVLITLLQH